MTKPKLFAAGGAHIDRRGRISGPYVAGASNPGTMREEAGGGAFNALRNAARRGCEGTLLSVRGGDMAGEAVARAIREAGITDLSATFLDRATPSYTAFVEANGEVVAGLADMGLYDLAFAKLVRRRAIRDAIARADAVLCDANPPEPALERLAFMAGERPLFAVAISPAKVIRLRPILARIACLFMNRREAAVLSAGKAGDDPAIMARTLAGSGMAAGVISAGGRLGPVRDPAATAAPRCRFHRRRRRVGRRDDRRADAGREIARGRARGARRRTFDDRDGYGCRRI